MDQSISRPTRIRRSSQEICKLLDEFAKAGVDVKTFCDKHGIRKATFYKWQSRYKNKLQEEQSASKTFADIHIISPVGTPVALFAEVKGIKLYRHVTAAYLKELVS